MVTVPKVTKLRHILTDEIAIAVGVAGVDPNIAALGPAKMLQFLEECGVALLRVRGVTDAAEHADAPEAFALLRTR
jgi:hypothetical protein